MVLQLPHRTVIWRDLFEETQIQIISSFSRNSVTVLSSITLCNYIESLMGLIQSVTEKKANILRGHSIGHSKEKNIYVHVSYTERFPR
jgi:hypothetical protein